jgi:hypothetical protein
LGDVDEHFLLHRTLNFLCIDFIFVSADAEVASRCWSLSCLKHDFGHKPGELVH